MDYERKYLLYLAGCGARGVKAAEPLEYIDWERMNVEAKGLGLEAFVGEAVRKSAAVNCPEELRGDYAEKVIRRGIQYHYGLQKLVELQEALEREGISTAVLKGYALSRAYAVPGLRMGHDVDLYVAPDHEKRTLSWLYANGWKMIQKRRRGEHHSELGKKEFGIIELHVALHPQYTAMYYRNRRGTEGIWEPMEPFCRLETEAGSLCTLGINDHLMMICVHMFRHMLEEGGNMRMLLDLAAFLDTYQDRIDQKRLWSSMEKLHCKKVFCTALRTAEAYFGYCFDWELPAEVSSLEVDQLADRFCDPEGCDAENRNRLRCEYNRLVIKGNMERCRYKLFMLLNFSDSLGEKFIRHGVRGSLRLVARRFREIMFSREEKSSQAVDGTLQFLRDMEMI